MDSGWTAGARLSRARLTPPAFIDRVLTNAFYLFFIAQILSPYISGSTIYIEVIVALIHPRFWRWVLGISVPPRVVVSLAVLMGVLAFSGAANVVKVVSTIVTVLYLAFTWEDRRFLLFRYLAISVAWGVAQFVLIGSNPDAALAIGPGAISEAIWGDYATPTYTNFFAVIGDDVRISGLSREGGFLAALIVASAAVLVLRARMEYLTSRVRRVSFVVCAVVLVVGFLLSISKISFVIVIVLALVLLRRHVDRIPMVAAFTGFMVLGIIGTSFLGTGLLDSSNQTFLHRLGGFLVLKDLDITQFLFGVSSLSDVHNVYAQRLETEFGSAAGAGGFIITYGVIVLLALLVVLASLRARATAVLIICVATLNVDFLTNQNFVSVAYFASLYLLPRATSAPEFVPSLAPAARSPHALSALAASRPGR